MPLVARVQLDFVEQTLADFTRASGIMRPIVILQAQHIAIVVSLRSIGHVLMNVDADTPAKQKWLAKQWPNWKVEPIFANFIKPDRDNLLKEFSGFQDKRSEVFVSSMSAADPTMPSGAAIHVDFDPDLLTTAKGQKAVPLLNEAILFWDQRLKLAEQAFSTETLLIDR